MLLWFVLGCFWVFFSSPNATRLAFFSLSLSLFRLSRSLSVSFALDCFLFLFWACACCCVLCSSSCSSEMYIGLVHASIFHSCCCCSIFAFSLLVFAFTHSLLELACFFPGSRSRSSWMQLRLHCIIGFGYASACVDSSSSSSSSQRLPLTPKQSCRLAKRWRTSEREREMWVLVT